MCIKEKIKKGCTDRSVNYKVERSIDGLCTPPIVWVMDNRAPAQCLEHTCEFIRHRVLRNVNIWHLIAFDGVSLYAP